GKRGKGTWEVKVRCGDDSVRRGCRIKVGDDRGTVRGFWGTWEVKVRCGDDSVWRGCMIRAGDDRGIVKLFWQEIWLGRLGAGVWVWANYTTGPCGL
nr:hypothetical protein [Tanacetum cinerariifolium]